jgi:hypothetical protein
MSEKSFEQQLAERRAEIAGACGGADQAFVNGQVAAGATADQASRAWEAVKADRTARAAGDDAGGGRKGRGNGPLQQTSTRERADSGSGGDFRELVEQAMSGELTGHKMDRMKAAAYVARKYPEAREACVAAANEDR